MQNSLTREINQICSPVEAIILAIPDRCCFSDGSWKNQDAFSGQIWYNTLKCVISLMGTTNTKANQSLIEYTKNLRLFKIIFVTNCPQLVKIISDSEESSAFTSYLEDNIIKRTLMVKVKHNNKWAFCNKIEVQNIVIILFTESLGRSSFVSKQGRSQTHNNGIVIILFPPPPPRDHRLFPFNHRRSSLQNLPHLLLFPLNNPRKP